MAGKRQERPNCVLVNRLKLRSDVMRHEWLANSGRPQNSFRAAHTSRFMHNWFTNEPCCRMENRNVKLTRKCISYMPCLDLASCQRIRKEVSHMTKITYTKESGALRS